MKKITIMFVVGLLTQQIIQAQGTVYLSNLGQSPTGSNPVGSDSWVALDVITGHNAGGYLLDSIQLGITDASGNPNGFTAMIYSSIAFTGINPGSSLGTLDGSANPSTAGIYTYTPTSNLVLSPNTDYFIVLTAGTAIADGAYEWSLTIPNILYGNESWKAGGVWKSGDGSSWLYNSGASQFAITATPVPEPSAWALLFLGVGVLLYARRSGPQIRGKAT